MINTVILCLSKINALLIFDITGVHIFISEIYACFILTTEILIMRSMNIKNQPANYIYLRVDF